jgi:competence protein ComEC
VQLSLPGLGAAMLALVLGLSLPLWWVDLAAWWVHALGGVAASVGVAILVRHLRRCCSRQACLWAMLALLVLLMCWGSQVSALRHAWQLQQALNPALQGVDLRLHGVVRGLPDPARDAWRFALEVDAATLDGAPVQVPPWVQLSWYFRAGMPSVAPVVSGERWAMTVRLRAPHGTINPSGFDVEQWAWQQGIGAMGYVRDAPAPERLQAAPWSLARFRQHLRDQVLRTVPDARQAGVLAALLVGDQAAIDRADWALYRDTGIAHLMAISGLHITLFAWVATALVRVGWRGLAAYVPALVLRWPAPVVAAWSGVALAAMYAVLAGWGIPAQRTVLMLLVAVALGQSGMRWPGWLQWLAVLLAVLLFDPMAPVQAGFWLSFVAVGLLWLGGRRPAPLWPADGESPWLTHLRNASVAVWALWREQWLITLGLTPLTLVLFGQVSWVSLLANLLAIPWVTWVITPLTLLGAVVPGLWGWAAQALELLHLALQPMVDWPWAVIYWPLPPWPWAAMAVAGGAVLIGPWPPRWRAMGVLCLLPAFVWVPPRPAPGQFEVLVLDVVQGGGTLVRTASHSLLYDTGPRWSETDAGDRVIVPLLRAMGERLDGVVVSHIDSDHDGGSSAVRQAQPQAWWLASFMGPGQRPCVAGQRWQWDGVDFEILHPFPEDYRTDVTGAWQGTLSSNAMSCVLRVSVGDVSVWLGGDIDSARELRLAMQRPQQRATAMLAPHHGSHTSSSPVLLNTLRPQQVWVQAGYRNRYQHPSPVVQQRWAERNLVPVQTSTCGAIGWRSQQPALWTCERHKRDRFWRHHPAPDAPHAPD